MKYILAIEHHDCPWPQYFSDENGITTIFARARVFDSRESAFVTWNDWVGADESGRVHYRAEIRTLKEEK